MNIPLNIDWQQIILHLFNFAILAGGLYLLLYKPVKDFMDKRTEYYVQMDRETKEHLEAAKEKEVEYQKRLDGVDDEIDAKHAQAARVIEEANKASIEQARRQAAKVVEDAKVTAQQERTKILESANREIVQMAMEVTKKILAEDAYEQFLNAAERSAENAE